MSLFQTPKQKIEQKLTAELSFKIMQIGQLIFELKTDYLHLLDEDTRLKLLQVNQMIEELAQSMTGSTAERMYLWRVEKEEKKRLKSEGDSDKNPPETKKDPSGESI